MKLRMTEVSVTGALYAREGAASDKRKKEKEEGEREKHTFV